VTLTDSATEKGPTHIKDLRPDPKNRRKHTPRNVGMIVDAIHKVGTGRSIVIDENDEVLAGNATIEAAAEAGITRVRVVETDGETLIAVRRRGLTVKQKRDLALYDNRAAELAEWDVEQLKEDIAAGEDLAAFFQQEELADLLAEPVEAKGGNTDPDDVPEERATDIVLGDMFQLGEHRLLCGDSTKAEDVARVTEGMNADLCLTDPPYGVGEAYESHDDTKQNLALLIAGFLPLARKHSRVVLLTPGNKNQHLYPTPDWTLCWFVSAGTGRGPWGFTCWQPVLAYGKDPYLSEGKGSRPDALGKVEAAENTLNHPCPKPVGVWSWFLERGTTNPGALVYEPFCGSGTTLIACEQLSRKCRAIEIEPKYVQVAIDRWAAFTGKRAVKL
jgi:hypothetical protein